MIPAAWMALPALPLNANGKVDRAALARRAEEARGAGGGELGDAPRTPDEELLAGIWAGLLGRERVGIHDDFFALGGHSLLATRVVAQVSRVFGVDLPVSAVFQAPTVAGLAGRIAGRRSPRPRPSGPCRASRERLCRSPSPSTGSGSWSSSSRARRPTTCRARSVSRVPSTSTGPRRGPRRDRPAARGPAHGLPRPGGRAGSAGRACHGGSAPGGPVRVASGARGGRDGAAGRREEARQPFDLARGPVWRALLLRLGPRGAPAPGHLPSHRLGRLVARACSWTSCRRSTRGRPLPELPVQYSDFAVWQREWLQRRGAGGAARLLARTARGAAGPGAAGRPAASRRARSPRERVRSLALPPETAAAVEPAWPGREGVTLFMALLGAFQALLARYTGESVIPVGSPVANRRRPEVERLIGLFVNTLVLDARTGDDPALARLPGAGAGSLPGRLRAPGPALRAPGRGAGSRAATWRRTRSSR